MRGAVTIVQAVLLFAIIVGASAFALPWAYSSVNKALDLSEMDKVKMEFGLCNDKLIETARTGSPSKCFFSANRGDLYAQRTGIYYKLVTKADVCDSHWWKEIDADKNTWQKCQVSGPIRTYYLNWYWPKDITITGESLDGEVKVEESSDSLGDIIFDETVKFRTLVVNLEFDYKEGQVGRIMEINRVGLEEDKAILSVNIK